MRKVTDQLRAGARTIHAVSDKLGTPTYTEDFARNLLALVNTEFYGRYHMACLGEGSRLDVARLIVAHAGRDDVEVVAVDSSFFANEYSAPRPRSEIMRNYMLELHGLNLMRPWNVALREYLDSDEFGARSRLARVRNGGLMSSPLRWMAPVAATVGSPVWKALA